MKISFAFSPCPNDTFMFEPIVSSRIDTEGLEFDIHLDDVEALNLSAFEGKYDITKLSYNTFAQLTQKYQLLNSGSALGRNCGPLLISNRHISADDMSDLVVAIPGKNTTANFLLSYAYPNITHKKEAIFSEVEALVLQGEVDAGVIIHENRFTYESRGLVKILDLGSHWEEKTKMPIPLGGIGVKRELDMALKQKIDRVISRSVAYAMKHPDSGLEYIRCHAQEMDYEVMHAHISLYVNDFSLHMHRDGKASIYHLLDHHPESQGKYTEPLFVHSSAPRASGDFLSDEFWTRRYSNNTASWDVGHITPALKSYIDTLPRKDIKILIPGAGNSYEAEYLHQQGFSDVTVLDISPIPIENLKKRVPTFPHNKLIEDDFFNHQGSYDLILEQTFFCALHPDLREAYAQKMKSLLSKGGKLAGLLFDFEFPYEGPAFGGKVDDYKELFKKYFDNVEIAPCHNSIGPRQGMEVFFTGF